MTLLIIFLLALVIIASAVGLAIIVKFWWLFLFILAISALAKWGKEIEERKHRENVQKIALHLEQRQSTNNQVIHIAKEQKHADVLRHIDNDSEIDLENHFKKSKLFELARTESTQGSTAFKLVSLTDTKKHNLLKNAYIDTESNTIRICDEYIFDLTLELLDMYASKQYTDNMSALDDCKKANISLLTAINKIKLLENNYIKKVSKTDWQNY